MRKSLYFIKLLLLLAIVLASLNISCPMKPSRRPARPFARQLLTKPLPFVKQWQPGQGKIHLTGVSISANTEDLKGEVEILKELMQERQISVADGFFPVQLQVTHISLPSICSRYRESIKAQAYRLVVNDKSILIQAPSAAGVFYGIQTLRQMLDSNANVPQAQILDWPDLSKRMIMVDTARLNENIDYYKRLINFCGRYKINVFHMHLTDDSTSCLYQEDYPWLMDPHALGAKQIEDLVAFANRFHIEILPEIESLGHSAMFKRHPQMRHILHQMPIVEEPKNRWYEIGTPGFTNVLCPASELTYEYLDKMYKQTADCFPHPVIHIGCDEVDMTSCKRCEKKFPGISKSDWFAGHLLRCRQLVAKHNRKMALWGDMLLHHKEIADKIPVENTIIFDWHYHKDVSAETSAFFAKKGFQVVGCPALVCYPHMILPDEENYFNIRKFAQFARENDLLGLDTTIWLPMRYMSDVLWAGIAFAAVQSWASSNYDEAAFCSDFMRDFFDSPQGSAFRRAWNDQRQIKWRINDIYKGLWVDEQSLEQARQMAQKQDHEVQSNIEKLSKIRQKLNEIGTGVKKNQLAWEVMEQSSAILSYTMEHLLASKDIYSNGKCNKELVRQLDKSCLQAIAWIEKDWDRNRFADDLGKDGIYYPEQHLLYRLKMVHRFHQKILNEL